MVREDARYMDNDGQHQCRLKGLGGKGGRRRKKTARVWTTTPRRWNRATTRTAFDAIALWHRSPSIRKSRDFHFGICPASCTGDAHCQSLQSCAQTQLLTCALSPSRVSGSSGKIMPLLLSLLYHPPPFPLGRCDWNRCTGCFLTAGESSVNL